jgi:hypothetical protein
MSLEGFATAYNQLTPGEQAQFADAVRRLLAEGIIWRENEHDWPVYNILTRRRELVTDYLQVIGWEMRHHERANVFHVVHRDGAHRQSLSRDTTIWLLLARMIYAEQRERLELTLTRHPSISVADFYKRYTEFLPGQAVRKKTSMDEALRTMQSLKLIRAGGGGRLRANEGDTMIELLPVLEVVMSEATISQIAERLDEYDRSKSGNKRDQDEQE